jgi:hypothetical protein
VAKKLEFTVEDMKKAFLAGQELHSTPGSITWQRWMRTNFPERYIRNGKNKVHQVTKKVEDAELRELYENEFFMQGLIEGFISCGHTYLRDSEFFAEHTGGKVFKELTDGEFDAKMTDDAKGHARDILHVLNS